MPPRLVIFDFDGTIADSARSIALTARTTLVEAGHAWTGDEAFLSRVGLPLEQIFFEIVPHLAPEECASLVAAYRRHYPEFDAVHTKLFDGMLPLMHQLRQTHATLAIATGKSTAGAHHAIARLQLDPTLFACVFGSDSVARPKPFPDMVASILDRLAISPHDACVVGDTTFDMAMGAAAETASVGVTWGAHDAEALRAAGAWKVVDTPAELVDLLFGWPLGGAPSPD